MSINTAQKVMVWSHLAGREVPRDSEEWRHECECRWVLALPTKQARLRYLYGTQEIDSAGRTTFAKGIAQIRSGGNEARGKATADRIKADCMRLHALNPSRPDAGSNESDR